MVRKVTPDAPRRCIRVLFLGILMANEIRPSAAAELTLLPKERPLAAEMRTWLEDALTRLPPDQRALVMGVEPQGVIAFDHATVLPSLVENAHTGITAAMVAARDAANQAITDAVGAFYTPRKRMSTAYPDERL